MHVPQVSLESSITPTSALSVGLHNFVGVSWRILMPYTVFGVFLIVFSQIRLTQGQKVMRDKGISYKRPLKKRVSLSLKSIKLTEGSSATVGRLRVSRS